ncbi:hypothetical protein EDD15DRAFT_2119494, partial [Pisolithus albus]
RFWEHARMRKLNEAFELSRTTLELHHSGHPERYLSLCGPALGFSSRYNNQGVVADLEEALTLYREALAILIAVSLNNLGVNLQKRFGKRSTTHDLDEALELRRAVSELHPPGYPEQSFSLHRLTRCFSSRYDNLRAIADLGEAVRLGRVALILRPPGHRHRTTCLYNLSCNLWTSSGNQAAVADWDEAICLATYALELRLLNHGDYAAFRLCALGHYLRHKFRKQYAIADLNEAITLHGYVLQPGHPSNLHDLALCLVERFRGTAAVHDLEETIALEQ